MGEKERDDVGIDEVSFGEDVVVVGIGNEAELFVRGGQVLEDALGVGRGDQLVLFAVSEIGGNGDVLGS